MDELVGYTIDPSAAAEFEVALVDHRDWLRNWHRAVICNLPLDPDLIADNGATRCRMGKFLQGECGRPALSRLPGLGLLDYAHASLHAQARALALKAADGQRIDAAAYGLLLDAVAAFDETALAIQQAIERARSDLDPLTGLQNRRAMRAALDRERARGRRGGAGAVIAIGDLDHFKDINDAHGHSAGDRVLQTAAHIFQATLRPYDTVYRYGGEEFLFCLPNTDALTAQAVLERLRIALVGARVLHGAATLSVSASFGIAPLEPAADLDEAIERADRALYAAKRAGRNRVVTWHGPVPIAFGNLAIVPHAAASATVQSPIVSGANPAGPLVQVA